MERIKYTCKQIRISQISIFLYAYHFHPYISLSRQPLSGSNRFDILSHALTFSSFVEEMQNKCSIWLIIGWSHWSHPGRPWPAKPRVLRRLPFPSSRSATSPSPAPARGPRLIHRSGRGRGRALDGEVEEDPKRVPDLISSHTPVAWPQFNSS